MNGKPHRSQHSFLVRNMSDFGFRSIKNSDLHQDKKDWDGSSLSHVLVSICFKTFFFSWPHYF